ncbi:MAG: outer membrane beta-barrel protein [Aquincola sp.]|nr:outer membrane beta-barrel protein [Aquincola sp.]
MARDVSDTVFTSSLGAGLSARFGRQRAYARGTLSHTRYADIGGISSSGYNLDTGLDWQTVGDLSGTLSAGAGRRQADFNTGISTLILKNTEKFEELRARAQWGGAGLFGIEGTAGWRRVGFSAPEFAAREYEQGSGSFGVLYRPSSALTLGTGIAVQASDYDVPTFGQTQPESNERRDVYVSADWQATGASNLGGRLNFGKTDFDRSNAEDISGVTGAIYWRWRPTGRTAVSTTFSRDTGQESGFQRFVVGERARLTATDFSRITNQLTVGVSYDLTGKVVLTGNLSHARRSLVDTLTNGKGRDNTTLSSLRADWAVTRIVTVGCEVGHETRSASGFGSFDYAGSHVGCMGRVTID